MGSNKSIYRAAFWCISRQFLRPWRRCCETCWGLCPSPGPWPSWCRPDSSFWKVSEAGFDLGAAKNGAKVEPPIPSSLSNKKGRWVEILKKVLMKCSPWKKLRSFISDLVGGDCHSKPRISLYHQKMQLIWNCKQPLFSNEAPQVFRVLSCWLGRDQLYFKEMFSLLVASPQTRPLHSALVPTKWITSSIPIFEQSLNIWASISTSL